jgi:hypothetical protein
VYERQHARIGRLSQAVAWLVPAAAAVVYEFRHACIVGGDAPLFVRAGRILLSHHWSLAFANPAVQGGPLQLALFGSLGRSETALALVLATGTALLVVAAVRAVGVSNPAALGGAGLLAVASGFAGAGGHPADAVSPLVWILAAVEARRGRAWRAGLLIGLSAGLETWGILGLGVLALAPRRRDAGLGAVVAGVTALALFAPFVVDGHFAMLSFVWRVGTPSLLSVFVPAGTAFGWPLRLLQGAFALAAGAAMARFLRDSPHVVWVAPLAIVLARLLLDPLLLTYYLAAPEGPIFVGIAVSTSLLWLSRQASTVAPARRRRGGDNLLTQ